MDPRDAGPEDPDQPRPLSSPERRSGGRLRSTIRPATTSASALGAYARPRPGRGGQDHRRGSRTAGRGPSHETLTAGTPVGAGQRRRRGVLRGHAGTGRQGVGREPKPIADQVKKQPTRPAARRASAAFRAPTRSGVVFAGLAPANAARTRRCRSQALASPATSSTGRLAKRTDPPWRS